MFFGEKKLTFSCPWQDKHTIPPAKITSDIAFMEAIIKLLYDIWVKIDYIVSGYCFQI